jgi:hypothetical protein
MKEPSVESKSLVKPCERVVSSNEMKLRLLPVTAFVRGKREGERGNRWGQLLLLAAG